MSIGISVSSLSSRLRPKAAIFAGPALMLSSALVFAAMDCFIQALATSSFSVWSIGFYRFGCSIPILLVLFPPHGNPFKGRSQKYLILRAVSGTIAFLGLVWSFQMLPISTAMVLFYAYPAFATLFSALLFKEASSRGEFFWVLAAFLGVAVFFDSKLQGGVFGQAVSLVAAAFGGIAVSFVRKARETEDSATIYLYFCVAGTIASLAPFFHNPQIPSSWSEWLLLAGIVVSSTVAHLLMNEGFLYCRSSEGSLILTCELIFVALWGVIFLKEAVTWHFWAGGSMILCSIFAMSRLKALSASTFRRDLRGVPSSENR